MIRPRRSSSRNTSQVAQRPTRFAFAMRTRGASGWVVNTPTGFPDCTSSVSSSARVRSVRQIASNAGQSRAAFPVPPYTTRSWGRSATSGSRLFMSMRSAASCFQPLQRRSVPRGARISVGARISRAGIWATEPPWFNDTRSTGPCRGHPAPQVLDRRGQRVAVDSHVVAPRDGVDPGGNPLLRLFRHAGVDAGNFIVFAGRGDDLLDGGEKIRVMELRGNAHGLGETEMAAPQHVPARCGGDGFRVGDASWRLDHGDHGGVLVGFAKVGGGVW